MLIYFIYYLYHKNTKCYNWEIGLNNTRIYNNKDEYVCQIDLPKSLLLIN